MKHLLLSAAAVVAFTAAAGAADLPSRRAPPVYAPPATPAFTWSGFYGGFNAGADFNNYTNYSTFGTNAGGAAAIAAGARSPFLVTRTTGFAGGGQIGYNFQLNDGLFGQTFGAFGNTLSPIFGGSYGGVVAGIEADADGFTNSGTGLYLAPATGAASVFRSRTDFVGTVRGRLGYAFGNLLVFGTGGFAYGGVNDRELYYNAAGANVANGGTNRIQTGYAYGGGVEYAIPTSTFLNVFGSSAVTVKAEFIHYDLGSTNTVFANNANGNTFGANIRNQGNLARLGVNYKFGSTAAAPVVARY